MYLCYVDINTSRVDLCFPVTLLVQHDFIERILALIHLRSHTRTP